MRFQNCTKLLSLGGLTGLRVAGGLVLDQLAKVQSLDGLQAFSRTTAQLTVTVRDFHLSSRSTVRISRRLTHFGWQNNAALRNVSLPALKTVSSVFIMTTNAQLQFIACGNLTSIGQNTQIAVRSLLSAFRHASSSRCAD